MIVNHMRFLGSQADRRRKHFQDHRSLANKEIQRSGVKTSRYLGIFQAQMPRLASICADDRQVRLCPSPVIRQASPPPFTTCLRVGKVLGTTNQGIHR